MRKVAILFVVAVFVPSLVLAWLAIGTVRNQQLVAERQLTLLYQGTTDAIARDLLQDLDLFQQAFHRQVQALAQGQNPLDLAETFDPDLRQGWPQAEVGFIVALDGRVLAPGLFAGPQARKFRLENDRFLCGRESVEVYWTNPLPPGQPELPDETFDKTTKLQEPPPPMVEPDDLAPSDPDHQSASASSEGDLASAVKMTRKVAPTQSSKPQGNLSKINVETARFQQLVGAAPHGAFARFLQDELNLMFWFRLSEEPLYVFGAKVRLDALVDQFRSRLRIDGELTNQVCVALLNDLGKPVAQTLPGFQSLWNRPFVATEIGEMLPHWEVAAYLLHPDELTRSAGLLKLAFTLLILLLVLAIGVGGWLLTSDLNRQLALARQKTDFVSNVTHELKTPLTSIRMFAELLSDGRLQEESKRKVYLDIIGSETARLTRLINQVLDFSRLERGEMRYQKQEVNLAGLVEAVCNMLRPHLEGKGFQVHCRLPERLVEIRADPDALAQILVNLISNAEKYADQGKIIEITVHPPQPNAQHGSGTPNARVTVEDRGPGVPPGCGEKIFEQFFRAHDSLDSGIEGSGLGLTLARQIARAHGGDIHYLPRPGGGSCFVLELPENHHPSPS